MSAAEATFRPQADGRSAIEDTIEGELVHEVYQTMRVTSFFMLLFGAVWTLLTRGKVPEWALYGWVGSLVVFVLLFHVPLIFLYHRYREARSSRFWMRTIEWAAVAGSTIYGALPWLLFPHVDQTLAVAFTFGLALGPAVAVAFFIASLRLWLASMVPMIASLVVYVATRWPDPQAGALIAAWVAGTTAYFFVGARRQHHARRELMRLRYELADVSAAKSRLLAAASHDLRQPLHAAGMLLGALGTHVRSDTGSRLLSGAQRSLENLGRMFNALLDISRLEAGTIDVAKRSFPASELLESVATELQLESGGEHAELRVYPREVLLESDPLLLERILRNLVVNALQHASAQRVVVGVRRDWSSRGWSLAVWDDGRGVDPADLPAIFQEYSRGAAQRARGGGMGLGLNIVKRLCELLGHDLVVRSRPGRGTCFSVKVPLGRRPEPVAERAASRPSGIPGALSVLIVDDDRDVREGTFSLLRSWNHRPYLARDLESALQQVARLEGPPDVILADFHLGDGSDGIAVVRALRDAAGVAIPAAIVTGDTTPAVVRQIHTAGLFLLHKPVQPGQLRPLVSRLGRGASGVPAAAPQSGAC